MWCSKGKRPFRCGKAASPHDENFPVSLSLVAAVRRAACRFRWTKNELIEQPHRRMNSCVDGKTFKDQSHATVRPGIVEVFKGG